MKTWLQLKTEIKKECNIEGEEFISEAELLAWANDAKLEAEAETVSMKERYMEAETNLNFTQDVSLYAFPDNIVATKITGMYFNDGVEKYEIKQIYDKKDILIIQETDRYRYRIANNGSPRIQFYPAPRETNLTAVTVFYIRASNPISVDTSVMDFPLAEAFVKQYIKDKVKEKELGPMSEGQRSASLANQMRLLIEALVQRTPDDSSDMLPADMGYYDMTDYGDFNGY